jgi:hypothetical protein
MLRVRYEPVPLPKLTGAGLWLESVDPVSGAL